MDDVQVLCDLEIDMAEARSTWQQVKSLFLADCWQSIQSNHIQSRTERGRFC